MGTFHILWRPPILRHWPRCVRPALCHGKSHWPGLNEGCLCYVVVRRYNVWLIISKHWDMHYLLDLNISNHYTCEILYLPPMVCSWDQCPSLFGGCSSKPRWRWSRDGPPGGLQSYDTGRFFFSEDRLPCKCHGIFLEIRGKKCSLRVGNIGNIMSPCTRDVFIQKEYDWDMIDPSIPKAS